jgi:hypothetical protein
VLKVNLPHHWPMHMFLLAAYGQLGDTASAGKAMRQLIRVRPDFAAIGRSDIEKWWDPEFVGQLVEGWRKGGLQLEPAARDLS